MTDLMVQTMTSTQFCEMTGREKKHINEIIKREFACEIDEGIITSSLDSRGYVTEYHLPIPYAVALVSKLGDKDLIIRITSELITNQKDLMFIIEALQDFDTDELPEEYFVYVAKEEFSGRLKVGISKDPESRVKSLNVGNPEHLTIVAAFMTRKSGHQGELAAHRLLACDNIRSEWFSADANYMGIKEVV